MISWLNPYRWLLYGGFVAALALCAYTIRIHYEGIGYARAVAEYTSKALAAEQAARAQEQVYQQQLRKAEDDFRKRQTTLDRDRRAAVDSANSLRDTIEALSGNLPSLTAAACADQARAYGELLGTVVEAGGRMAAEASEWHSEAVRVRDSWSTAR